MESCGLKPEKRFSVINALCGLFSFRRKWSLEEIRKGGVKKNNGKGLFVGCGGTDGMEMH